MEPKFSSPERNASLSPNSAEAIPNLPTPETGFEAPVASPEYGPVDPERSGELAAQAQAGMAAQPIPITLPTPDPSGVSSTAQAQVSDDLPAIAGDEDLIEKEWVDKAKQIISQTRDDPARREKEVGRLQADYLKKRYGKQLGASPE